MTVEQKRIKVDDEGMRLLLEEATIHPLIVEINGAAYRVNTERVLPDSPYTIDNVYASLPPLGRKEGGSVSNEELENMIEAGKEANARDIRESLNEG